MNDPNNTIWRVQSLCRTAQSYIEEAQGIVDGEDDPELRAELENIIENNT
jgi:hypothetical protein